MYQGYLVILDIEKIRHTVINHVYVKGFTRKAIYVITPLFRIGVDTYMAFCNQYKPGNPPVGIGFLKVSHHNRTRYRLHIN